MNDAIGQVLGVGVGVALSPIPIVAVVLMLATPRARSNGPAFLLGWIAGLTIVGAIVPLVSGGADATGDDGPATWVSVLKLVLGALLLALALKQWRGRPRGDEAPPLPKWMQTIDAFQPPKALAMGALLSGVNPKNLLLTVAAATAIAQTGVGGGRQAIALAIFIVVGSLGVGAPVVIYFALGERSQELLDELKAWMIAHNAAIMAAILLVLGAKLIGDGLAGL
jgi:threonine/homoserine/homoserine lactone efflux protein